MTVQAKSWECRGLKLKKAVCGCSREREQLISSERQAYGVNQKKYCSHSVDRACETQTNKNKQTNKHVNNVTTANVSSSYVVYTWSRKKLSSLRLHSMKSQELRCRPAKNDTIRKGISRGTEW